MKEESLQKLRAEIDTINQEIVVALTKRALVAQQIGMAKGPGPVYLPGREKQVLAQVRALNKGPLSNEALEGIFKEIIAACRNLERRLTVAYLGPAGTYSHEAALHHAGSSSAYLPCNTIDDALVAVEKGEADIAVVPVENSTEGAVNRTLDLLLESRLQICGEITLPIHHQLLAPRQGITTITEVLAHPQALAQCRKWLEAHMPKTKQVPVASNAEAARLVAKSTGKAAIASRMASETYRLSILEANIEDAASNTTRFLVLGKQTVPPTGNDKTSIVCSVPNRAGSLYELLGIFARNKLNMTKLESRPAESALWDYVFYIDIDGHQSDRQVSTALQKAKEHATLVKVLGSYPKAAQWSALSTSSGASFVKERNSPSPKKWRATR